MKTCMIAILVISCALSMESIRPLDDLNGFMQNFKFSKDLEVTEFMAQNSLFTDEQSLNEILSTFKPSTPSEFNQCTADEDSNYFHFMPSILGAVLKKNKDSVDFKAFCFQNNKIELKVTSSWFTGTKHTVELTADTPVRNGCYDWYFVGTANHWHVLTVDAPGVYQVHFDTLTEQDLEDVNIEGFRTLLFCEGLSKAYLSIYLTLKMFMGGFGPNKWFWAPTPWMEKANVQFLQESIGYTMEERYVHTVPIEESMIHSGDFLAIVRLDGLDQIIGWGTGSRVGHSTMALWKTENGTRKLYVVESQDAWYWPHHGVQKNEFSKWREYATNCGFNVAILPLKKEVRKQFNEAATWEAFDKLEGEPYGYSNFLYGWIDTPHDNFPPLLKPEFLQIAFRIAESIDKKVIDMFLSEGLNKRLNTSGLGVVDIEIEAHKRNMSFFDLMAMKEVDGWEYKINKGINYVCSSFVVAMYKASGILPQNIQGTEFTPRDLYMLNLFDKNPDLPTQCRTADMQTPYCQFLGKYRINLGEEYSTVEPYDFMNENCPSVAPDFHRPDGC